MDEVGTATAQLQKAAALDKEGRIKEALPLYLSSLDRLMAILREKRTAGEQKAHVRDLVTKYIARAEALKATLDSAPQAEAAGAGRRADLQLRYPAAGPAERALLLLRDGLAPLVDADMARATGSGGVSAVEMDPHGLLALIWRNWAQVFQESVTFPHANSDHGWTRTLVAELRHWRNAHAHQGGSAAALQAEDVWRVVDSAERLLAHAAPPAPQFAREVRRMKPPLLAALRDSLAAVEMGLAQ
uniref:MIT domain-containing protein n=1 Tax=Eutreptiella gymnastica TaxID=73025 RepID=A0A7S4CZY4_9EUGL